MSARNSSVSFDNGNNEASTQYDDRKSIVINNIIWIFRAIKICIFPTIATLVLGIILGILVDLHWLIIALATLIVAIVTMYLAYKKLWDPVPPNMVATSVAISGGAKFDKQRGGKFFGVKHN